MILQTLQQLRAVYGEQIDKIVQGNTSNIVFLKSTDDSMIDTLQKMSGIWHRTYSESKTITKDQKALLKMTQNEGKISIQMQTKEEPVISYNDMAFIGERNSIVFRAGDSPIWNRNETILPMSWRLFKNTIIQPGKEYSLQTIPTLSTAMEFDVRKNQPNFRKMFEKRCAQAAIVDDCRASYQEAYGYSEFDIEQLDPDVYSDDIMDLVYSKLNPEEVKQTIADNMEGKKPDKDDEEYQEMFDYLYGNDSMKSDKFTMSQTVFEGVPIEDNKEQASANAEAAAKVKGDSDMRYAGRMISRDMLVSKTGVSHALDAAIIRVFKDIRGKMERDDEYFMSNGRGDLCGINGEVYIKNQTNTDNMNELNEMAEDEKSRLYAEGSFSQKDMDAIGSYTVTDAFLRFLVSFPKAWPFADGEFESRMKREMMGE